MYHYDGELPTNKEDYKLMLRSFEVTSLLKGTSKEVLTSSIVKIGIVPILAGPSAKIESKKASLMQPTFILGERVMRFEDPLASGDLNNTKEPVVPTIPKDGRSSVALLSKIFNLDSARFNALPYFHNLSRRAEIFYPIVVQENTQTNEPPKGAYLYAWTATSSANMIRSLKIKKFVTAGCLFGTILVGKDARMMSFPLIKHDLEIYPGQIITSVSTYDNDEQSVSFYEELQLEQFASIADIIQRHAITTEQTKIALDYHLPYFDYILYGIKLFLNKQITSDALLEFFTEIYNRKTQHIERIQTICTARGITVNVISPFDDLFGRPQHKRALEQFLASIYAVAPFVRADNIPCPTEEAFTNTCLDILATNNANKELWEQYIRRYREFCSTEETTAKKEDKTEGKGVPRGIEGLFYIANPLFISVAAKGYEDYEVCSVLNTLEKQIAVGHTKFIKNTEDKKVIYLTLLDTAPSYGEDNQFNGNPFYFNAFKLPQLLSKIIPLLEAAQENIAKLAMGNSALRKSPSLDSDAPSSYSSCSSVSCDSPQLTHQLPATPSKGLYFSAPVPTVSPAAQPLATIKPE